MKKILQATYGKDIKVRKALIVGLEGLRPITNISQIRETHEFSNKLATMKKLETAHSHVQKALVQEDDDWEEWDLEQLVDNLRKYVDRHPLPVEDSTTSNRNVYRRQYQENMHEWKKRDKMMMANAFQKSFRKSPACVYCGKGNHRSADCFKMLDVAHRREILKKNNTCFNCTGTGHIASKCRSRGCLICGGRHHTSVCESGLQINSKTNLTAVKLQKRVYEQWTN